MDTFKDYINADSIAKVIITKRPISKMWGFPDFILKNPSMLEKLFGPIAYREYVNLSDSDKKDAIKWFETHGVDATEMYGGELYEDWNDSTIPKRDLYKLKNNFPKIYGEVVKNVVSIVYGSYTKKTQDIIVSKYIEHPDVFEGEISRNER